MPWPDLSPSAILGLCGAECCGPCGRLAREWSLLLFEGEALGSFRRYEDIESVSWSVTRREARAAEEMAESLARRGAALGPKVWPRVSSSAPLWGGLRERWLMVEPWWAVYSREEEARWLGALNQIREERLALFAPGDRSGLMEQVADIAERTARVVWAQSANFARKTALWVPGGALDAFADRAVCDELVSTVDREYAGFRDEMGRRSGVPARLAAGVAGAVAAQLRARSLEALAAVSCGWDAV